MEIPPRPWYALPRFFRDPITSGSIVAYGIQFPSLTINACSTCLFSMIVEPSKQTPYSRNAAVFCVYAHSNLENV